MERPYVPAYGLPKVTISDWHGWGACGDSPRIREEDSTELLVPRFGSEAEAVGIESSGSVLGLRGTLYEKSKRTDKNGQ